MICNACPRSCGVDRQATKGVCGMGENPVVARAALHMWEEPCISGTKGSGTVFFSGCSLKCCYCQNYAISAEGVGKEISIRRLKAIYHNLIAQGAHNINLVNPTHFAEAILKSLEAPLPVPVVYNCGGYEKKETLQRFAGKVQIYLTDFKYNDSRLASRLSKAADYPQLAQDAIIEMYRQTGDFCKKDGLLQRGVIIRHLVLPGQLENTYGVIDWVARNFRPGEVLFSLMGQYTPCGEAARYPELNRCLAAEEYEKACAYLATSGIIDGFTQAVSAAEAAYIPPFDFTGVE